MLDHCDLASKKPCPNYLCDLGAHYPVTAVDGLHINHDGDALLIGMPPVFSLHAMSLSRRSM